MPAPIDLVELSAFKARTLQWRQQGGVPVLTIVAKTTFRLAPGLAELADLRDDVNERDLHAENNPKKGLHSASDLAPYKPRADVTVVGKAYSPPRELSRMVTARVQVGTVDKRVQVHADRFLDSQGRIVDDKFFSKMGIGYERAFGEPGTANPVGIGMEGRPDSRGRVKLPNLQAPGTELTGPNAKRRPYAFGPIPPTWPSRHSLLHGASIDFLAADSLSQDLPAEFHWAFFNVGPPDQQLEEIRADQNIRLEHLHPDEAQLDIQLPGYYPCVYMQRADEAHRVQMQGDTLWIDTNRLVLTVTWRAQVTLEGDADAAIRVLVSLGTADHKPAWDEVWAQAETKRARDAWAHQIAGPTHPPVSQRSQAVTRNDHALAADAPTSLRGVTSPIPLRAPGSDRQTQWLPPPPVSDADCEHKAAPPSSAQPGPLVVEVALPEDEVEQLRALCNATGLNASEMLRQALHEAHKARFDSSS